MPKGYAKELFPEMYGGAILEVELPSYTVYETAESGLQKIRLDKQYLVCEFCGTADEERRGSVGSDSSSWCLKCGRAFLAVWKMYRNEHWINVNEV